MSAIEKLEVGDFVYWMPGPGGQRSPAVVNDVGHDGRSPTLTVLFSGAVGVRESVRHHSIPKTRHEDSRNGRWAEGPTHAMRQRIATLEETVAELKRQLAQLAPAGVSDVDTSPA